MPNYTFPEVNVSFNENLADLLKYGNTVTNDMFGFMILVAIFAIVFISARAKPVQSFSTAAFITTISSYFMLILGLVGSPVVVILTLITGLSVIFLFRFQD